MEKDLKEFRTSTPTSFRRRVSERDFSLLMGRPSLYVHLRALFKVKSTRAIALCFFLLFLLPFLEIMGNWIISEKDLSLFFNRGNKSNWNLFISTVAGFKKKKADGRFRLLVHDLLTFRQEELDPRLRLLLNALKCSIKSVGPCKRKQ